MIETTGSLATVASCTTQHGMLIVWGHFARTIGLLERLGGVLVPQKTVLRPPHEKVVELFVGLLSGIEYLTDLSEGAAPVVRDAEVATAWRLHPMADASGVSRTLQACDDDAVRMVQAALDVVGQPFLQRAIEDLRQRNETLVLDGDLTGRPVSSTSETFPGAAFGYMDGEVRLGYQLAQVCLRTHLFGRQWLSAQHHPGSTVSSACLLDLVRDAERQMGCHPRRRTELLQQRIIACQQAIALIEQQIKHREQGATAQTERIARLQERIRCGQDREQAWLTEPVSARQQGPYSKLNRLRKQIAGWQGQLARAQGQLIRTRAATERHRQRMQAQVVERDRLQERYDRFCQENVRQPHPPRCKMRLDAGFCSAENLTELIELGYDVDTKSGNDALVQTLRKQVPSDKTWTTVGKNAEMVAWTSYYIHGCPYPLSVGLERFHTPKKTLHAVLVRYQERADASCPDLKAWFHDYNGRQTIEAGNKEEKTTFKVQHLMSRSPAGIRIQAMLTVFAANFVRWADEWIRPRVEQASRGFTETLSSPKRLVRIAANSPATIDRSDGRESVRFSPLSSFAGVVICLSSTIAHQLPLPLFTNARFSSA